MNVLLVIALTCQISQCPPSYSGPIYSSQVIYSKDHNYIHYSGQIHSKKYVTAVLENGQKISVPIINGLLPRVKSASLPNGGMQRDFWYDQEFKYDGREEIKYTKKDVVSPKASYSEDLSKTAGFKEKSNLDATKGEPLPLKEIEMPDPKLEEIIRSLEKTLKETKYDVPSLKSLMPMKKPSEFDKESK